MPRLARCAVLLLLLLAGPSAFADSVPAWQGHDAQGHVVKFDPAHRSRPAILLFWATWCPYCETLMPYVQHVLDAAGKDKLDVYAIDIKEDTDADPVGTLKKRGLTFTLIRDGDPIAAQYGIKGTPGLLLVDAHGAMIYKRNGGDEPAAVEAALREKLKLPAKP